jgi:hypothetical protein
MITPSPAHFTSTLSRNALAALEAILTVLVAACSNSDNPSSSPDDDAGSSAPILLARCMEAGEIDEVSEHPADVVFGCDGTGTLHDMNWTAWGPDGADGTGTAHQTLCDPSCAAGPQSDYAVVVHAEGVRTAPANCQVSFRYYSKLIVAYSDRAPEYTDSTHNDMPAIEYDTTPFCAQ